MTEVKRHETPADSATVWAMRVGDEFHPPPSFTAVLDDVERSRAAAFRFDQDRRRYIAAHALRRALLTRRFGGPPAGWVFSDRPLERPRVLTAVPGAAPVVSLTHTRGLVAAAVADGVAVGVDAEAVTQAPVDQSLASAVCGGEELRRLAALERDAAAWRRAFFRLWVAKEAYAKAVGLGLSLHFPDIAFTDDGGLGAWRQFELEAGPGHALAVVVGAGAACAQPRWRMVDEGFVAAALAGG